MPVRWMQYFEPYRFLCLIRVFFKTLFTTLNARKYVRPFFGLQYKFNINPLEQKLEDLAMRVKQSWWFYFTQTVVCLETVTFLLKRIVCGDDCQNHFLWRTLSELSQLSVRAMAVTSQTWNSYITNSARALCVGQAETRFQGPVSILTENHTHPITVSRWAPLFLRRRTQILTLSDSPRRAPEQAQHLRLLQLSRQSVIFRVSG